MYWFGVYISVVLKLIPVVAASQSGENCFTLFNKCNSKYNCFASLINVKIECNELLSGEGTVCTKSCREAIEMFNEDPMGKHFLDCSCDRDSECLTYQARATKCLTNRMNQTTNGCAIVSRRCANDTDCTNVMEKFYVKCTHLISGTECTPTCEYVQTLLYAHNITKGLLNCECSGTLKEENFCRGIRAHTFHLCKTSPLILMKENKDTEKNSVVERKRQGAGKKRKYRFDSIRHKNAGRQVLASNVLLITVLLKVLSINFNISPYFS